MDQALIGYSGFVGSTLLGQTTFQHLYRSHTIQNIHEKSFDMVVCSGAPAQKWLANQQPAADLSNLQTLVAALKTIQCRTMILISTVDVFKDPQAVDEDSLVSEKDLHAYGRHRYWLEQEVCQHFPNHLIVRLSGLVGKGLRKNVLFDLLNKHDLQKINGESVFQFYPLHRLWEDIQQALAADLRLVHLVAEPLRVKDIANEIFNQRCWPPNQEMAPAVAYDVRSRYASLFGQGHHAHYTCTKQVSLEAIRRYALDEPCAQAHASKASA